MALKRKLHKVFLENEQKINQWFEKQAGVKDYPFYCSFDIRESDFKIAPVDANLFPAGFNNICQDDREAMKPLLENCADYSFLNQAKHVVLFCEEHTQNPYYWDNVHALQELLKSDERQVHVTLPVLQPELEKVSSASGFEVNLDAVTIKERQAFVKGHKVDLIISNNDYSSASESWIKDVDTPNVPPLYMGWHRRRKSTFFKIYNSLVQDFSQNLGLDPFMFTVATEPYQNFEITEESSLKGLKTMVEKMQESLAKDYQERKVNYEPNFFIKNSYGTYGLGVTEVSDPGEVLKWNYKARKKMKASKGGGGVSSVIVQEGIPTTLKVNEAPAEAVIYLLGCGLAGGFLRTNERKSDRDSLNAPGAVFQRMCFSDYEFQKENKVLESVYGTVARLGALALSQEIQASKPEL